MNNRFVHELHPDSKGRISIPAWIRHEYVERMNENDGSEMILTLFPYSVKISDASFNLLRTSADPNGEYDIDESALRDYCLNLVSCNKADNSGRIILSQKQLDYIGYENRVVLVVYEPRRLEMGLWGSEWDEYCRCAEDLMRGRKSKIKHLRGKEKYVISHKSGTA